MDKICGIYKITSPSGGIYIGQSTNINGRKSQYKRDFGKNQSRIYNSIVKYGWNTHTFEVIHECQRDELNDLERYYIKLYDTFNTDHGMNLTNGGDTTTREISDETRMKMRKCKIGTKVWVGRKHTEESKLKMSISHIGKTSNLGRKHSEESKLKMSKTRKGKKVSEETKQKIIKALTGRICTEETKRKISKTHRINKKNVGRVVSTETREKLHFINTGKKRSKESCERIRIANIGKKHSDSTKMKISNIFSKTYEIYNQNNELIYKFKGNFRTKTKELGLSRDPLRSTFLHNKKIKRGVYKGWYAIQF